MLYQYLVLGKKKGKPYRQPVKVKWLEFERKTGLSPNHENIRRYIVERLQSEGVVVSEIKEVEESV